MSTHNFNPISWDVLIADSEAAIQAYTHKISQLRKSIRFFKKQKQAGSPFPLQTEEKTNTHQEKS